LIQENNKKSQLAVPRKDRVDENTFQVSRWTPKIKDILEYCIENHLDPDEFPYVSVREHSTEKYKASRYISVLLLYIKYLINYKLQE